MTIRAVEITSCKECDSKDLSWQTDIDNRSGVQQGRLRTSDVRCLFILGCNHCSETLAIINADQVAELMNDRLAASQAGTD
jgi:hypothetical protein